MVEGTSRGFVLDTSFTLALVLEEEEQDRVAEAMRSLNGQNVLVPPLWFYEVSNALLTNQKRGRLQERDKVRAVGFLRSLPISVDSDCNSRALEEILVIARAHSLTVYDATYLDLAMRSGLPLATLDNALIRVSQTMGVELL